MYNIKPILTKTVAYYESEFMTLTNIASQNYLLKYKIIIRVDDKNKHDIFTVS